MTQRKTSLDGLAIGLLLACCLFWGFQQVLVKATIAEVPAVFQAAIRFNFALVLIWLWCRWRGIAVFERDGSLWPGLLAGALFAGEFSCLYTALQFTGASRATVFLYTSPFWVALVLPLLVKSERLGPMQWVGLTAAFVGVAFALREGLMVGAGGGRQWLGDLLALGGGMFWGLTTVVLRSSRLGKVSPEKQLIYQVGVSAAVLPLLSLGLGEAWVWTFSIFAISSLVIQTVVGAFVSYLTWMWMLSHYPTTRMSAFVFLTPVFALVFGALWLREPVTVNLIVALALVTGGIVLVGRKPAG
jgi:drug/metabolite transporter (DMT)-like permease